MPPNPLTAVVEDVVEGMADPPSPPRDRPPVVEVADAPRVPNVRLALEAAGLPRLLRVRADVVDVEEPPKPNPVIAEVFAPRVPKLSPEAGAPSVSP